MERLDRFMARAAARYYATHDPFADFTTAPEISQIFGELIGAWAATQWSALGRPAPITLVELGPGRGTLMGDALRTIATVAPDFAAALRVMFVETSPRLSALLGERFPEAAIVGSIAALPAGPAIVLGNEFLDALPVREFVRRGGGWTERHVDAGRLVEVAGSEAPPAPPDQLVEGDVIAWGEAAEQVLAGLARRAARGAASCLLIDYGGEIDRGSTLQAISGGVPADPLERPGRADLTAHVDFAALARVAAAEGARPHGPVPQGLFLTRLGLYARAARLAAAGAADPVTSAARLAQPEAMGVLFKAFAVTPLAFGAPAGFEA